MSDPNERDDTFIRAARRLHDDEGVLEIDEDARVSRSDDNGAYVEAWVWVGVRDIEEYDRIG